MKRLRIRPKRLLTGFFVVVLMGILFGLVTKHGADITKAQGGNSASASPSVSTSLSSVPSTTGTLKSAPAVSVSAVLAQRLQLFLQTYYTYPIANPAMRSIQLQQLVDPKKLQFQNTAADPKLQAVSVTVPLSLLSATNQADGYLLTIPLTLKEVRTDTSGSVTITTQSLWAQQSGVWRMTSYRQLDTDS